MRRAHILPPTPRPHRTTLTGDAYHRTGGSYPAAAEGAVSRLHCDAGMAPSRPTCQRQTCLHSGATGDLRWNMNGCTTLSPCRDQPDHDRTCEGASQAANTPRNQCKGLTGEDCTICLDDEEMMSHSGAWRILLWFILILTLLAWPCIMFACAHHCCIKRHESRHLVPTDNAWMICGTLLSIAFLSLFVDLPVFWILFGTLMVVPFFLEGCYAYDGSEEYGARSTGVSRAAARGTASTVEQRREALHQEALRRARVAPMAPMVSVVAVEAPPPPMGMGNPLAEGEVVVSGTVVQATPYTGAEPTQPAVVCAATTTGAAAAFGGVSATFEVEDDPDLESPPLSLAAVAGGAMAPPSAARSSVSRAQQPTLTEFLGMHSLLQYETALKDLGAVGVADLREISVEELNEDCGMKVLEVKRMLRGLKADATTGGDAV